MRVQDIYGLAEIQGKSADEILQALPDLSLAQVHAALSYYFDHREGILNEMREDEDFAEQMRILAGPGPLEQKLRRTTPQCAEFSSVIDSACD